MCQYDITVLDIIKIQRKNNQLHESLFLYKLLDKTVVFIL